MTTSTNFAFVGPIYSGLATYAAARSLFGDMFGVKGLRTDATRLQYTQRISSRWAARVRDLGVAGWLPALNDRSLYNITNCKPAFAVFAPTTLCCRYYRVCPFCHARRFIKLWRRVRRVLFPGWTDPPSPNDPAWRKTRAKLRASYSVKVAYTPWQPLDMGCSARVISAVRRKAAYERRKLLRSRRNPTVGAISALDFKYRYGVLLFRLRDFLVIDNNETKPALWDAAVALSRVIRYPKIMLMGSADVAVGLLTALASQRTVNFYGVLRGAHVSI